MVRLIFLFWAMLIFTCLGCSGDEGDSSNVAGDVAVEDTSVEGQEMSFGPLTLEEALERASGDKDHGFDTDQSSASRRATYRARPRSG